jgi:hypothetical protein
MYDPPGAVRTIQLYPSNDAMEASTDDDVLFASPNPTMPRHHTDELPEELRLPRVLLLQAGDGQDEAHTDFEGEVAYGPSHTLAGADYDDLTGAHQGSAYDQGGAGYDEGTADYDQGVADYDVGSFNPGDYEPSSVPDLAALNATLLAAVQAHPKYEGAISRREAANILSGQAVGTYLLRYSEHTQQGVLSMRVSDGQQHHLFKASLGGVLFNDALLPNCYTLNDALELLADPIAVKPFMRQAILSSNSARRDTVMFPGSHCGSTSGSRGIVSSGSMSSRRGTSVQRPPSAGALGMQAWYHGAIDRAEAESRLETAPSGSAFLVRQRGDGSYALSLRVAGAYTHHLLDGSSDGVLLNGEAMQPACATVQAAVEALQQRGQGVVRMLGQGVAKPDVVHRL